MDSLWFAYPSALLSTSALSWVSYTTPSSTSSGTLPKTEALILNKEENLGNSLLHLRQNPSPLSHKPSSVRLFLSLKAMTSLTLHPMYPAVEWGNDRSLKPLTARTNSFSKLAADIQDGGRMVHSLRSTGSSVLNFAFVAQGSLDLYWSVSTLD